MTQFVFTKAVKQQEKLRLALDGPAGSGKTWTALTIATYLAEQEGGRIAVIDSERSSAKKYASDFDFDHLTLPDFQPHTYIGSVRAAVAAGYAVIVIDSFSHAWEGILEFKDNATARSRSKNSYTEGWREATPVHNELVDTVLRADAHVIATLRTKTEYVIEDGKPQKIGTKPIQRDGVDFEFDVVGDMTSENSMVISKTRCSALTGQVIRKPDHRVAETLWGWLNDGEPSADRGQVAEIKGLFNEIADVEQRTRAKHEFIECFGRPESLTAALAAEGKTWLTERLEALKDSQPGGGDNDAAGQGQPAPGTSGDVAVSEPTPHNTGNGASPPAPEPDPNRAIGVIDVGVKADAVFDAVASTAPKGKKTKTKDALRHALVYAATEGRAHSTKELDPKELHDVYGLLHDIEAGDVRFTLDLDLDKGIVFTWTDGTTTTVMWSELAQQTTGSAS